MVSVGKKRLIILALHLIRRKVTLNNYILLLNRMKKRRLLLAYLHHVSQMVMDFQRLSFFRREKIVWQYARPQYEFEENYTTIEGDPDYWKKHFRMSKEIFLKLLRISSSFLSPDGNCLRPPIPLEKRLAVSLNWLATGNSYQSVGQAFGVSKPAVIKFVKQFINGMCALRAQYIKFPKTISEIENCVASFHEKTNLPNVVGAVDGTHVDIIKPEGASAFDYYSRKQRYTIVNQAVCDGNLLSLSVDAGFPGSIHDNRMLEHSQLHEKAENGEILNIAQKIMGNKIITPYLLGDPAYPCLKWLLSPYAYGTKDGDQKRFNYQLSRARSCIERAFGLTKQRFRILYTKMGFSPKKAAKIFLLCCILHNILILNGDDGEDILSGHDDNPGDDENNTNIVRGNLEGEAKRKFLARHLRNV